MRARAQNRLILIFIAILGASALYLWLEQAVIDNERASDSLSQHARHRKEGGNSPLLVILVISSPDGFDRRSAIRSTWFSFERNRDRVLPLFIIAAGGLDPDKKRLMEQEQHAHRDMVLLESVQEGYDALTAKVAAAFSWVARELPDAQFVMKVDDDTFVRTNILAAELEARGASGMLYWGYFDGRAPVFRTGKWAEKDWILCDRYLPYALGGGYVLGHVLVKYIANNIHLLTMYHSEDVSVGAWLGPLRAERWHDTRFDTEWKSRGCQNEHLVSHKQSQDDMFRAFHLLMSSNGRRMCDKEETLRPSYEYDWQAKPSKCCPGRAP